MHAWRSTSPHVLLANLKNADQVLTQAAAFHSARNSQPGKTIVHGPDECVWVNIIKHLPRDCRWHRQAPKHQPTAERRKTDLHRHGKALKAKLPVHVHKGVSRPVLRNWSARTWHGFASAVPCLVENGRERKSQIDTCHCRHGTGK